MQTTLRRPGRRLVRGLAAATLVLAIPAVSACSPLELNEQTNKVYQPAEGSNDRSSEVDVLGAVVVSATPGSGTFITTLVNNSTTRADRLTGVQGQGVQVAAGSTPVPAGGLVNFADPSVGGVEVRGSTVAAGGYVELELSFQYADPVTIDVPVLTDTGPYAGLAAGATPSAPNSTATKGSQGALASPSATPTK